MKANNYIIFIITWLLNSGCSGNSSTEDQAIAAVSSRLHTTLNSDTVASNKYISIYKYNSTYIDSSLVSEQRFLGDSLVKKDGEFHYRFPVQSEFIDEHVIDSVKGEAIYETFDSLICETGGQSVWNKYVVTYDNEKRPVFAKHYKAWFETYDKEGNPHTNTKPAYFLGEEIHFQYDKNEERQIVKNENGGVIEKIIRRVDNKSQLIFEQWDARDEYRFRIYYTYSE